MNLPASVRNPSDRRTALPRASVALALLAGASPLAGQDLNADLIRVQCEAIHQISDQSIIYGMVKDGRTGLSIPGGQVRLRWETVSGVSDTTYHSATAEPDNGAYIFCDVPQDTRLRVSAAALGGSSSTEEFYFEGGESERRDLEIVIAQINAGVTGRLTDSETGDPIGGATVQVVGVDASALTDRGGRFTLREIPIGRQQLQVSHIAYGEPVIEVTVDNGQATHVAARLEPRAVAVEPISVEITRRPAWLVSNGFYDRVDRSLGQFVTPEMIEQRSFARFSEVLQQVPGVNIRTVCTPRCFERIGMAGSTQGACLPTFYMDGRQMNVRPIPRNTRLEPAGLIDLDALAAPGDLAAVEVYRSIAETPAQYYGRCGSIVIWTKRGVS